MKQKSIKLNFIMNAILTVSGFIFPLISFPYISRILTPVGNGKVQFAVSIVAYFMMFAQLGIPTYGIRVCAKVREDKEKLTRTAQELLIINLIMTVIAYLLFTAALILIPRLRSEKTLFSVVGTSIFLNAIGMDWLFQSLEQYTFITVKSLIFKVLAIAGMFLLIKSPNDYILYGAYTVFATSASNILNIFYAGKFIQYKPVGKYNFRQHLKPVLLFFAMACATTVYNNLDEVMLGFMKGDAEVGLYNAAVKVKMVLVGLVTSLGTVLLPRLSYYVENKRMEEFQRLCKKALNFVLLAALPLTVYFMTFAKNSIMLLSGIQYEGAVIPMQIIMPCVLFIGITNILGIQILIPQNREKVVLISVVAGAVIDLFLNAIFIPKLGAVGAALGTLVAEFVVLIIQILVLREFLVTIIKEIQFWKIIAGTLAGYLASFWVLFVPWDAALSIELKNFIILLISAVLFFAVDFGILLLTKESFMIEIVGQVKNKLQKKFDHTS